MAAVRVVTDSTAGLSAEWAAKQGVSIVPIGVSLGARSGWEGVDIGSVDVLDALRSGQKIGTSQPSPSAFADAYTNGSADIVSIHLSGELSGTIAAAELAATDAPGRVLIVDSRLVSAGLALVVEAAAAAAKSGMDAAEVAAVARQAADATTVLFCVDDLNALKAGGRIGPASARLGTALSVKPLLRITDGAIAVDSFVRTSRRAIERLAELAAEVPRPARTAVVHLGARERAETLAALVSASLEISDVRISEVSAAIAAHTGEGVVGIAVMSKFAAPT